MTLTIDLTPELEAKLQAEAEAHGIEIYDLVKIKLDEALKPRTGAEIVDYLEREGLFGDYGDMSVDSPEYARAIREKRTKVTESEQEAA